MLIYCLSRRGYPSSGCRWIPGPKRHSFRLTTRYTHQTYASFRGGANVYYQQFSGTLVTDCSRVLRSPFQSPSSKAMFSTQITSPPGNPFTHPLQHHVLSFRRSPHSSPYRDTSLLSTSTHFSISSKRKGSYRLHVHLQHCFPLRRDPSFLAPIQLSKRKVYGHTQTRAESIYSAITLIAGVNCGMGLYSRRGQLKWTQNWLKGRGEL